MESDEDDPNIFTMEIDGLRCLSPATDQSEDSGESPEIFPNTDSDNSDDPEQDCLQSICSMDHSPSGGSFTSPTQPSGDPPTHSKMAITAMGPQSSTTDHSEDSAGSPRSLGDSSDDLEEDAQSMSSTDLHSSRESLTSRQPSADLPTLSTTGILSVEHPYPTTDHSEDNVRATSEGSFKLQHDNRTKKPLFIPAGKTPIKTSVHDIKKTGPVKVEQVSSIFNQSLEKRIHVITKPRVFTRADAAPKIIHREKNFVKAAIEKKLVKTEPKPTYVDWGGRRNVVGHSLKYTQKNDYGKVPDYLQQRYRPKREQEEK